MKNRVQFGAVLLAMAGWASLPAVTCAQSAHSDRPTQSASPRVAEPAVAQHPSPTQGQPHAPQAQNQNGNPNRPPGNGVNHPQNIGPRNAPGGPNQPNNYRRPNNYSGQPNYRGQNNLNGGRYGQRQQQPGTWVDKMRSLTPQQRENVFQHSSAFQGLAPDKQNKIRQQFGQWDRMSPTQRADLQQKESAWKSLSPQQREHIKNDVIPTFHQMPWERQQMINQKLAVLQNMPESARNQRLSDPNFTSGMSDQERSTLQDLSHTHLGGVPDQPAQ